MRILRVPIFLPGAIATDFIKPRGSVMAGLAADSDEAKQKGFHFWKPYVCWCREPEIIIV
ncbi:hypothetical protein [Collimonas sp. OK412]|jgi:hypothetical protein|uniref:hypothetical protein n=1 Tax=Collimonas sp. (strain OK412) TaxID=1801619 RepID=UPI000B8285D2|nr:hypothetical protein [Collimonas sp. OK412]